MEEKPQVFNLDSSSFAKKHGRGTAYTIPLPFLGLRLKTAAHKFVLGKFKSRLCVQSNCLTQS